MAYVYWPFLSGFMKFLFSCMLGISVVNIFFQSVGCFFIYLVVALDD